MYNKIFRSDCLTCASLNTHIFVCEWGVAEKWKALYNYKQIKSIKEAAPCKLPIEKISNVSPKFFQRILAFRKEKLLRLDEFLIESTMYFLRQIKKYVIKKFKRIEEKINPAKSSKIIIILMCLVFFNCAMQPIKKEEVKCENPKTEEGSQIKEKAKEILDFFLDGPIVWAPFPW